MLRIKKLYLFVLQTFLPIFFMTFFISLFILLMQFLWRYIDDLVGKGLSVSVLAELFFYATLNLVPMALPLSILLASLMTFGNLGESLELLAMKSAGISLIRIMRSLIITLIIISIGSFFFQNNLMPKVQVKLWGLMYAVRQKSPELDIPERVFYDKIEGYNMYVEKKNPVTGTLYNVMLYDFSRGFEEALVISADSATLKMTSDKKFLVFSILDGESFENLPSQRVSYENIPYRRETFKKKQILIPFDANFKRSGNEMMQNQYFGKNISELRQSIDSMNVIIDSINRENAKSASMVTPLNSFVPNEEKRNDSIRFSAFTPINIDSLYKETEPTQKAEALNKAVAAATSAKQEIEYKYFMIGAQEGTINRHYIEWHKKFTLSFACLIFFFIGAPLGAIIRKGGLGMPVVLSVFLFILYYIIDSAGYKLARDGRWEPLEGMWLSSAVLLPLGVFLTYKAVRDSSILNSEAYALFFKKIFGKRGQRELAQKELVIYNVDYNRAAEMIENLTDLSSELKQQFGNKKRSGYVSFWSNSLHNRELFRLNTNLEELIEEMNNSKEQQIYFKLLEYPLLFVERYSIVPDVKWIKISLAIVFPVGIPLFLYIRHHQKRLITQFDTIIRINTELLSHINTKKYV